MGVVYRARHAEVDAVRALKVLHRPGRQSEERFRREARVQGRLDHPNLVRAHDLLEHAGRPVIVLDFVDGGDLAAFLRGGPLTLAQGGELVAGVMRGLVHAHGAKIVHRDLKPENVLLHRQEGAVVPRITDFGLARVDEGEEQRLTRASHRFGSVGYCAPEQLLDPSAADEKADVFALGCVIYEVLTGRRAFEGATLAEVADHVLQRRFRPLLEVRPEVPARWEALVHATFDPDPDQRPTAAELLAAWAELPPSPWTQADLARVRPTTGGRIRPAEPVAAPVPEKPTGDPRVVPFGLGLAFGSLGVSAVWLLIVLLAVASGA
jgi:serine/threonine protein kinase